MPNLAIGGTDHFFPSAGGLGRGSDVIRWAQDVTTLVNAPAKPVGTYNVQASAYGAIGNSTTDDTAAIQAALTAAPSDSLVRLPEGNYKITKPLYKGTSRVHIKGDSLKGTTITTDTTMVGPALYLGIPVAPNAAGAPLLGSTGYSLQFPQAASNYRYLDFRETNLVELNGWTRFTFEAIWKPSAVGGNLMASYGRIMQSDTADQAMLIQNSGTALVCSINLDGTQHTITSSAGAIPTGAATHVAFSYDGTTLRSFANGILVASKSVSGGAIVQKKWENFGVGSLFSGFLQSEQIADGPRGDVDQVIVASNCRWNGNFSVPTTRGDFAGGTQLFLDCATTYGPFVVARGASNKTVYLPTQYNNLDNPTSRIEVSHIAFVNPKTAIHANAVTDLHIHDIRFSGVSVGAVRLFNNCFYSFLSDLDIVAASTNRYGIGISAASGVTTIERIKSSCAHMPLSLLASDGCDIRNVYMQDTRDICILIMGVVGQAQNLISGCSLGEENVFVTPTALIALSDARATTIVSTVVASGSLACPCITMDGLNTLTLVGSTFGGDGTAAEVIESRAGNAGAKTINALGCIKFSLSPWTLSTSAKPFILDGNGPSNTAGISGTTTGAKNLRGTMTISGASASGAVTFGTAEADATYFLALGAATASGSPAAGALRPSWSAKATGGFTVNLEAAPGTNNSVAVDWLLIR